VRLASTPFVQCTSFAYTETDISSAAKTREYFITFILKSKLVETV